MESKIRGTTTFAIIPRFSAALRLWREGVGTRSKVTELRRCSETFVKNSTQNRFQRANSVALVNAVRGKIYLLPKHLNTLTARTTKSQTHACNSTLHTRYYLYSKYKTGHCVFRRKKNYLFVYIYIYLRQHQRFLRL